jgi:hypothetical protein
VWCLAVDLVGSTRVGLERSTSENDHFNEALPEQFGRHIKNLDLVDCVIQFTGDGWLVSTSSPDDFQPLCVLGLVMARCFQVEMAALAPDLAVPAVKAAICVGRDIPLEVPQGRVFVGDSARRASRSVSYAQPGELLVDGSVQQALIRDFVFAPVDKDKRESKPKRDEEPTLALYALRELTPAARREASSSGTAAFAYLLARVGDMTASAELTRRALEALEQRVSDLAAESRSQQSVVAEKEAVANDLHRLTLAAPTTELATEVVEALAGLPEADSARTFDALVARAPSQREASDWLDEMKAAGVRPSVASYNRLIHLSSTLGEAKYWLDEMTAAKLQPNVVTYNTLMNLSSTLDDAKHWLDEMKAAKIQPNVVTYSTLINLSSTLDDAKHWLDEMKAAKIQPNVVTYNTLINLSSTLDDAKHWLDEMKAAKIQPDVVTYNTLISLSPTLQVALEWLSEIRRAGLSPQEQTASTLLSKTKTMWEAMAVFETYRGYGFFAGEGALGAVLSRDPGGVLAAELLAWFWRQPHQKSRALDAAIGAYRRAGQLDQALEIALYYPHLPAAKALMKRHPERAEEIFRAHSLSKRAAASYALGCLALEHGDAAQARASFEDALAHEASEPRKGAIRRELAELS